VLPVPEHAVRRWGDAWATPEHYVASGPFQLVSWKLGDRIVLARNPRFYDAGAICLDRVEYYPVTDPIVAEHRVRSGGLDINTTFNGERLRFLRGPDGMPGYVHIHPWTDLVYVVFRTTDPALSDVRVRLALDLAIDRDFIADKLLRGVNKAAYTFVPPGVANYVSPPPPVWASWPLARRQAAARVLLAQAGYGPGHSLAVEIKQSNSNTYQVIMPSIQSDWRAIGVTATLIQEEAQIAFEDYRYRNFQVATAAWIADYNDAMSFLYLQQSTTGAQNYGDYANPVFDGLLAQADNEPDIKKRAADLERAEAIMLRDAPITPLVYAVNTNLVNPRVTGFVDNIVDQHRTRYLCLKGAGPR
jgi:oligopeptide transport system substrate-binding protein